MGLLAALDFYNSSEFNNSEKYEEEEYRLYSWGEIFPPFLGNREHSIIARWILKDFPFKLICSSTPHDDPLPQKLCLTFRSPFEERKDNKSFGFFSEEIAKEFAAFLSLVTRRRVFAGKMTRSNGLPIEQEIDVYRRSHFQEPQQLKEIDTAQFYQLLKNLQSMDRSMANSFVLAMRLYHTAVEMMYTEPEFSYLFLVTCLETISSAVYKKFTPPKKQEFLDSRFSGWRDISNALSQVDKPKLEELLLKNEKFFRQKLSKFVNENLPERFWTETEDDAKPDYLISKIGLGGESISHADTTIRDWEKIEKGSLNKVLQNIYEARSKFIHDGVRLPASIVIGHFRRLPVDASITSVREDMKTSTQIPPLITFERLISYSIVEFLHKQKTGNDHNAESEDLNV